MRRVELDEADHALLLDALRRQHRATADPQLAALHRTVAAAPRLLLHAVTPQPELPGLAPQQTELALPPARKSGDGGHPPPPSARRASVGAPEGAAEPGPLGAAVGTG